jgi:hypothetical protein
MPTSESQNVGEVGASRGVGSDKFWIGALVAQHGPASRLSPSPFLTFGDGDDDGSAD